MKPPNLCMLKILPLACLAATATAWAVEMPAVFSDRMILQRDVPIPIWGQAAPDETVNVEFAGQRKEAKPAADGRWMVRLDPLKTSTQGATLKITGKSTVEIKDVLVGEVWFCSGQSNMQQPMREMAPEDPQVVTAPLIRQFGNKAWTAAAPATIGDFSAVAFYFARRVQQDFPDLPIGLIVVACGSTAIETWTPLAAYEMLPGAADKVSAMRAKDPDFKDINSVSALYRQGVLPIIPYAIRGVLWYQGESNQDDGEAYLPKFRTLIDAWRVAWGQGDPSIASEQAFPFYYVQLANYKKPATDPWDCPGYGLVREAQRKALALIPNVAMAVAIDVGDIDSIHPRNKFDIGSRLALIALSRDYGKKELVASGPLFREMKDEGGKLRLFFDHADGLMVGKKPALGPAAKDPTGKLQRFAIAGEDKKWVWADAVIDGQTVIISSSAVPKPVAARYAMSKNPEGANLYNGAGLPSSPFRTDAW